MQSRRIVEPLAEADGCAARLALAVISLGIRRGSNESLH